MIKSNEFRGTVVIDNYAWWKKYLNDVLGYMVFRNKETGRYLGTSLYIQKISQGLEYDIPTSTTQEYETGQYELVSISWDTKQGHYQIYGNL